MYKHKNGLTLRLLEFEDLSEMKSLKEESWFGTHRITINNMEQQKRWFSNIDNKNTIFFIVENNERKKIGTYKITSIDWISRTYHSAHDVFEEHRGKGFSKPVLEAGIDFGFEVLNMNRIDTEVLENNIASLKTALWVGFVREGVKRKSVFKCGSYIDSICMGIIREDWEKLDRVVKMDNLCNLSYVPKNKIVKG